MTWIIKDANDKFNILLLEYYFNFIPEAFLIEKGVKWIGDLLNGGLWYMRWWEGHRGIEKFLNKIHKKYLRVDIKDLFGI